MSTRTISVNIEIEQKAVPARPNRKGVLAEVHTSCGGKRVSVLDICQVLPGEYFVTGVLEADHGEIEKMLKAGGGWKTTAEFDSESEQFCAYVSGWSNATFLAEEAAAADVRIRAAASP